MVGPQVRTAPSVQEPTSQHTACFAHSPLGIMVVDAAGRYVQVNPAACRITGYEEAELLAMGLAKLVADESCEAGLAHFARLKEVGHASGEFCITHKDGSKRWISCDAVKLSEDRFIAFKLDITERKRLERASEENFRTFFNSADKFVFVLSLEGVILHVNDTVTTKLGYSREELVDKSVLAVHPEDRHAEAARIVGEMAAGRTDLCTIPVLSKEGRLVPVETRVVKGRWDEREVLFGISQDLSELHASEERFSKAFQCNPLPMVITTLPDHRFVDVNASFLNTFGYQKAEVLGATTADLGIFPDLGQQAAALALLAARGSLREFEADVRTKDGQTRHGLFSVEFIQLQRERLLLTVMNDITVRKRAERMLRESEERYRLLVETIPLLAWRSSPDGLETDCNRRWYEYTGQTPAQVRGHGWMAVLHPEDVLRVAEHILHAASQAEPYELEYRLRRASDNTYRWHLSRVTPLRDEDGRITAWFGCATDIEDLKQAQIVLKLAHDEQFERHQAELAHVSRLGMMGELAASLAHELNQPLYAIKNYAYGALCRMERTADKDQELAAALEQIDKEAGRAAETIHRIKAFVRKRTTCSAEVSVNSLVEEAVVLTRSEIERARAKVAASLAQDLPAIMADPVQLEQVIINLIHNALEAMDGTPEEDRRIGIRTLRQDDDSVRVEVCDRGKGLPDAEQEKIFEPFFTTKPDGLGMGLAISRSIIQAHKGLLWVVPNADQGCSFHITLPVGKGR